MTSSPNPLVNPMNLLTLLAFLWHAADLLFRLRAQQRCSRSPRRSIIHLRHRFQPLLIITLSERPLIGTPARIRRLLRDLRVERCQICSLAPLFILSCIPEAYVHANL